jgi:hypothetical protein
MVRKKRGIPNRVPLRGCEFVMEPASIFNTADYPSAAVIVRKHLPAGIVTKAKHHPFLSWEG